MSNPADRAEAPGAVPLGARQSIVLTFLLDGEIFALDVDRVHEILDPLPVTHVPRAAPFVPSLVNVRGAIVPVVDIRNRMGMRARDGGAETRLVVVEVAVEGEPTKVALVVDEVREVAEIENGSIEELPELGSRWPIDFIRGIAPRAEDLLVLLNTDTIFRPGGLSTAS